MRIIDFRPPRIAMALTAIAAALHRSINLWETLRFSHPGIGAAVGIAGLFMMMWAWLLFKRQNLAVCLPDKTIHLTKAGPYRFSRNPMYLGMVLMMVGLALYIGTMPFYFSAIAFFVTVNAIFCPYEEAKLSLSFGAEYSAYKKCVRRWI